MCMPDLHSFNPREDFLVSAFQDDPRLVEMFREAESKRRWYHKIAWGPVIGGLIALSVSGLAWWALIWSIITANRWFQ